MNETVINFFDINTDAIATNRGFYYQYLVVLKKWILNFISENDSLIYTEVDDDIKEVGEKLVFTQVKCYTQNFSFKSTEIKKSIFNYFILYLKNSQDKSIEFCFSTNAGIVKSEKLLKSWYDDPKLTNEEIRKQCSLKIKSILLSEINLRKRKKIEANGITRTRINEIKRLSDEFKKVINKMSIDAFVGCIKWEFSTIDTEKAIDSIFLEIRKLLIHEKFENKPVSILESALLSEIYRCSQNKEKGNRVLSSKSISLIIGKTDLEIKSYINTKFIDLIGVRYEEIEQAIKKLQKGQEQNITKLEILDEKIKKLEGEKEIGAYPKELTSVPTIFVKSFYGRENCLNEIYTLLKSNKAISIKGAGGCGKTLLVQEYLNKYYSEYNHIVWINSSQSIINALVVNKELVEKLRIEFRPEETVDERFEIICKKLSQLIGENIIIIDNYKNDLSNLKRLVLLTGWQTVITTREVIPHFSVYSLPRLDFESVLAIYNNNLERTINDSKATLEEFFNFIDYNPLVIEIVAKTISSSIDLTLDSLLRYFKEQDLENEELNIDVLMPEENDSVRLLSYLQNRFQTYDLSRDEEWYLEFLALLPSEDVLIDDIANIGGKEAYKENKVNLTNLSNSLHRKGWVERKEGTLKMHRLIQELIIYNSRKDISPFISCLLLINWLVHRIDENASTTPGKSFKYLKYAESILFSIKEPYRVSLYQPLLLLENALLNAYNWIDKSRGLHIRWQNLTNRAEKHLSPSDINLGVIYNNLGFSYIRQNDVENSIKYFKKAIMVFEKNEEKSINPLINSLYNLSHNYFELSEIEDAKKVINKISSLKKKYEIIDKHFDAVHFNLLGFSYQNIQKFEKAIFYYEKAICTHLAIEVEGRNDFYLSIYYSNLIGSAFIMRKHDVVIRSLNKVAAVLRRLKLSENSYLTEVYELTGLIYSFYKDNYQIK